MTNEVLTTTVRGIEVLAKQTKYGICAKTFANRTQAETAAAQFGGWVCQFGRPFLVRFDNMGA